MENNDIACLYGLAKVHKNVPVTESINRCADLLFIGNQPAPPVDKEIFVQISKLASCDVIMSTQYGFFNGLAMGSPLAPYLGNCWLSHHDDTIKGEAALYARYMDDVGKNAKLTEINNLN